MVIKQSIPSREFLESLRRQPLPEDVFDDEEEDEDDFISETSASPTSATTPTLPTQRPVKRSNSLLSRAFSQLHHGTGRAAA
jgi:hypothetical protein